jgi:uncharacterized damage-inducible protein DinB
MSDQTLRELVYGKGAHVDPVACVEDISAELATRKVAGYPHSIWQIVEHMNYWMDFEIAKIAGKNPQYPDKAIESWPPHPEGANEGRPSEVQWSTVRQRFAELLARLAALADADSATLDKVVGDVDVMKNSRQNSVHTTLWQITAHNSYHAGQIALLRRQAGAWPPERGGDTW